MDAETYQIPYTLDYWYGYLDALRKVQEFALIRTEQIFWDHIADEHEHASTMISALVQEEMDYELAMRGEG